MLGVVQASEILNGGGEGRPQWEDTGNKEVNCIHIWGEQVQRAWGVAEE